jgi:hypothetical protein
VTRETKDTVALVLACTVAVFVFATLIAVFVLALRGIGLPDVWAALFSLMTALMGALAGWFARGVKQLPGE